MILVLEIIFLISGLWAIFTGKLPSTLFSSAKYEIEGTAVRLLGVLLVLPLPVAFLGGVVLALLFGERATGYATIFEIVVVLGVAVIALVAVRFIRKPKMVTDGAGDVVPISDTEANIARKAQGALMYALLGILGFTAIVVCPLAFIYATQAIRLIDEQHVGEQYRGRANAARIISVLVFLFYAAIVACLAIVLLAGSR